MKIEDLYSFNNQLNRDGILYCYSGPFTRGIVEEIGEMMRRKIEKETNSMNTSMKVFSVFVEQVQNIMNHSDGKIQDSDEEASYSEGIAIIGKAGDDYFTLCGNLVDISKKEVIENSILEINKLDKAEVKQLYKQKLKNDELKVGKGAGIGLLDIARKSNEPLKYHFQDVDDKYVFFSLYVKITNN